MKLRWPTTFKSSRSRPAPPSRPTPLRASARALNTVHRARGRVADPSDSYDEEEHPTTKLSVAFFVVVALHLVAVGGIYAFNSIKANRVGQEVPTVSEKSTAAKLAAAPENPAPAAAALRQASNSSLPVGGSRIHQVRPGESLIKIAAQHGSSAAELAEHNGLKETATLRSGQVLNLPPAKAGSASARPAASLAKSREDFLAAKSAETKKPAPTKALPKTYTVEKGDTLMAIVRKLGVPYDELVKANKIDDPKRLQIGQVLKVPGAK
jgi:LysM repeat protein